MKKNVIIFLMSSLSVVLWNSCIKDKTISCIEANTIRYPQDALDRFNFKDSTYWVYENILTKELDSIWVYGHLQEVRNKSLKKKDFENRCYEYISYRLNNTKGDRVNVLMYPYFTDANVDYKYEGFEIIFDTKIGSSYKPIYRAIYYGNELVIENQQGGILELGHIIFFKGVEYSNLLKLTNPQNNIDIYKEAWYAKNIGLIKYIKKDGSSWELIRYHINQ